MATDINAINQSFFQLTGRPLIGLDEDNVSQASQQNVEISILNLICQGIESLTTSSTTAITITPGLARVTSAGTVLAGQAKVSIGNVGAQQGTVLGAIIDPGEIVEFGDRNVALPAIAYDPTTPGTTTFLILTESE